jgi:hypothetical protein
LIPHGSQTELNREFENPRRLSAGPFFIALFVFAVIDYFWLRIAPSGGL